VMPARRETPTTKEAGLLQDRVRGGFAPLAPGGTRKLILEKLKQAMTQALQDPAVRSGFEKAGAEPMALPLSQVKSFHHAEIIKYRDIISKAGIEKIE